MSTPFEDAVAAIAAGAAPGTEAAALVAAMTTAEKLGCLDGDTPFWPGLLDMMSGGYYRHPWPAARVERLGVPGLEFADGPRGCVIGDATAFPVAMARGATFDPELEEAVGAAIGAELRASGATFTGAVCMNLLRHPAWGRAQETYGEDPHHVGVMAEAAVRGLQRHVMACMKHFALNSMENARFTVDVTVDDRALHEVYLPHFRRVAAAGVASVMSAYNSVNGEWCGQHRTLLTEILREEWEWDGVVVSDFVFGLRDPVGSLAAGLDVEMPFRQQRALTLADALDAGTLDEADVDRAVARVVGALLRFDGVLSSVPPIDVVGSDAHRRLARTAAVRATVLLANDGILPRPAADVRRVAVLGRLAGTVNLGDGGSSDVRSSRVVTPLDGLRAAYGDDSVVHHEHDASIAAGADLVVVVVGYTKDDEGEFIGGGGLAGGAGGPPTDLFPPPDHPELGLAAPWARPSTWPVAGVGTDAAPDDTTGSSPDPATGGMARGGDRASLRLAADDEALIRAAAAAHPDVVVVVQSGSAVTMPWVDEVRAVLMTWYGGVEGGRALADVLTGREEPGGRLPFAVPVEERHLVEFDRDAGEVTYGLRHGQWHLDHEGVAAHFPFGAGLGYTSWRFDHAEWADDDEAVRVSVVNEGDRAGSTVVFLFAGVVGSAVERPARRLVGFSRVRAEPGARTDTVVAIDWSALDVRVDGGWSTEHAEYVVDVARRAHDPGSITLTTVRGS